MSSSRRERSRSASEDEYGSHVERERTDERRREDDKKEKPLPCDAKSLSESDYFVKNTEFRTWLREEKDRYFDELTGEKARSYFRKFIKAWNRGKLSRSYYKGVVESQPATSHTAYRWSFAEKRTRAELDTLEATRNAVGAATRANHPDEEVNTMPSASHRGKSSRILGPTLPSSGDRVLMREAQEEARATERTYERKRARDEDKERIEDLVGPKERGREGMLEKKKMRREADKAARDAKDDTFGDYDESTLMGGGDSFQARIAQRDAARRRFEEKRASAREEKGASIRERQDAMRAKDKATMEMFKQMAKERFGG